MSLGRYPESIRELDLIQDNPTFQLACLIALVAIHKSNKGTGKVEFKDFPNQLSRLIGDFIGLCIFQKAGK